MEAQTPHALVGHNTQGQALPVTLYAKDHDHAVEQYNWRYGNIGYRVRTCVQLEEPEPQPVEQPAKRFRKRGPRKGPFRKRQRRQ